MADFDGWKFLAGLGIFLFGMFMMEESIKLLAGRSFIKLIRRYTGTRFRGLLTGLVSTTILQSSSAVSLMVLAFVGAGLIALQNAIAVLMGSMVGTTITAWIVAVFGFKFKIDAFALPLIGAGGLGLIFFSRSARYVHISKLCAAFGFLFLGLDYMKISVENLAASMDLAALPDFGLWVYVLAGIVMTAVMQSSSATIAIILTTLFSGIIDFSQAAAMVIGANVGTTVTILLGAIGGIPAKKQTALSAVIFNLGTAVAVLPLLPVLFWIIRGVFHLEDNAVLGIAAFHTLFNVLGVMLFLPTIPLLVRYLERIFPEKRVVLTRYLHNTSTEVPEAAVAALRKEVRHQLHLSMHYIAALYAIPAPGQERDQGLPSHRSAARPGITYEELAAYHAQIFSFYAQLQTADITESEGREMTQVIRASRSIMNAGKNFYELSKEIEEFGADDTAFMVEAYGALKARLQQLVGLIDTVLLEWQKNTETGTLQQFFLSVEEMDKQFIQACSSAVARGKVRVNQVTTLLMVNRLFTQSNRMLVLSMQALAQQKDAAQDIF